MNLQRSAPAWRNDGRDLEAAIADSFASYGYEVELNVVREGRSGARHEIDVLAVKRDALTTVSVAIECKSWERPIEKEVLSKLHYVMGDLGLAKGIVVSRGGARSGAERAAEQLAIELWGHDELVHHLGAATVAALGTAPPARREAQGWPFLVDEAAATPTMRASLRGTALLGRREELEHVHPVWVPLPPHPPHGGAAGAAVGSP